MSENIAIPDNDIQRMVVHGITDVFKTMLSGDVELVSCKKLEFAEDGSSPLTQLEDTLVVGNVGFVGVISGMVYFAMPETLAKTVTKTMLGMDDDDLEGENEMINDVIGELTNMSAGAYKNQMCDIGYNCRLTIPSIIRGKYFVVEAARASFRQLYLFKYLDKYITFELIMKKNEGVDEAPF